VTDTATATPTGTTLSHIPLFAQLDAAGDDALLRRLTRKTVAQNEPVYWFRDSGDTLYIIDSGRVSVTAPDADGNHVLLDTFGPGGIFGELSLLDGGPRSATVRARASKRSSSRSSCWSVRISNRSATVAPEADDELVEAGAL